MRQQLLFKKANAKFQEKISLEENDGFFLLNV